MITKIYAFNAHRYTRPFAANKFKPENHVPEKNLAQNAKISFKGNTEADEKTKADINNLPYDVDTAYIRAQKMLQNISDIKKESIKTGIEAQSAAKKAKEKASRLCSLCNGKIPAKISVPNEDGSEDSFFFVNGILNTYRKNERKTGDITEIDAILIFNKGKLVSYKSGITTTLNKGSARKDIEIEKSLEYDRISTIYTEGFKSIAGQGAKTQKTMRLIFGRPWYLEEEITEKHKEKPGRIKRRLEFSNEEKTRYSYEEDIKLYDDTKVIGKALYVEDNAPYRYAEGESFTKSAYNLFNAYKNQKLLYFLNGSWHSKTTY